MSSERLLGDGVGGGGEAAIWRSMHESFNARHGNQTGLLTWNFFVGTEKTSAKLTF